MYLQHITQCNITYYIVFMDITLLSFNFISFIRTGYHLRRLQ